MTSATGTEIRAAIAELAASLPDDCLILDRQRIDINALLNTPRARAERQSPAQEKPNNNSGEKEQQSVRRQRGIRIEKLGEKILAGQIRGRMVIDVNA